MTEMMTTLAQLFALIFVVGSMAAMGLTGQIGWYRDLRRYGTVPHAGFGLGFERLLNYVTGMENVRDAIPFPRTPGHAQF